MWRSQVAHLDERGIAVNAIDLPGHGTRIEETFTLENALAAIDDAVQEMAREHEVLLVGHSLGGLITSAYVGAEQPPPVDAFIAASCTAFPRGLGLAAYRAVARGVDRLPGHGQWIADRMLDFTLPAETRADFGAGGYSYAMQDVALKTLSMLDLTESLRRIAIPTWFVNGQYDQLRRNEKAFLALVPDAEFVLVPRTTHLVTAMRPRVFNAVIDVALATLATKSTRGART